MIQSSLRFHAVDTYSTAMGSKLDYFLSNTSIHGFKYLGSVDAPQWKKFFSRLFWTCFIVISIFLMVKILSSTLNKLSTETTSINLDTNYRDWNNTFPAVSICMTKGRSTEKIKRHMTEYWEVTNQPIIPRAIQYYRAIQNLMFINYHQPLDGVNVETCLKFNETCGFDMEIMRKVLFPQSCSEFMTRVSFLGNEMPCENVFKFHRTEIGDCFIANSLYSNGKLLMNFEQLPLRYSNREIIERSLEIHYKDVEFVIYKLFIHTPEEIPNGNLEGFGLRKTPAHTYMAFKTIEIKNQDDVKEEAVEARQCRFPDEFLNEYKLPYSIANCHFNDRMQRELNDCDCTLPIGELPTQVARCNITRFQCVKDSHVNRGEFGDHCTVPSCLATEISLIGQVEEEPMEDQTVGILVIDILNKPTLRYIRRVVITNLDTIGEENFFLLTLPANELQPRLKFFATK